MSGLLVTTMIGCARLTDPSPAIQEDLLPWTDQREQLTAEYAALHSGPHQSTRITPRMVVLHGTTDPSVDAVKQRFAPASLPTDREDLAHAGSVNVSTHYAIDRDGTIVRLLPENRYARHVVGFNHVAIGIEHVGDGPEHDLTQAQIDSARWLVADLRTRWPIEDVKGHHQLINEPESHPLFLELDETYRTFARDPGDAFVKAVTQ